MSKKIALTVSAVALLAAGAFVMVSQKDGAISTPAKPQATVAAKSVVVPELSAACVADLADEKLYDKHKIKSYATIVPGKDGWFFRADGDFRSDFSYDERAIAGFQSISNALKAKGVTLVVAIIPPKGIVVPEALAPEVAQQRNFDAKAALQSYKDLLEQMRDADLHFVGVDTFDPARPFFLKADQHWSQAGTDRMAQAVAEYVKTLPVYKDLPKQKFQTVVAGTYDFPGKYTDALRKICGVTTIPNETDIEAVTSPAEAEVTEDAMFGDQPAPKVILVGTSNSKREDDSNFAGALKEHLGTDVINNAISGVGYDDPLLIYLGSDEFKADPPKLIVWEIPGYYTLNGDKDIYKTVPASVWGDCSDVATAVTKTVDALPEDKITLFDTKNGDKIPEASYLTLSFDKPVKKKFTVSLYSEDNNAKRIKFEVSKRTSDRLSFMTDLTKDPTGKIIMNVPKGQAGGKLQARLCPKPAI